MFENGDIYWFQNGKFHRLDGPACEYANGSKFWYQNSRLHRLNGPAVEYSNGDKSWYIEGETLTEQEFNARINSCKSKVVTVDGKQYRLTEI